ncbi:hypothetical protein [Williamsia herbipolensis]|uniref:hypothetical protein n=1 Tax=Williamsia herbipolensis TaxID=1603258 RepID=UPI0012373F7F|nr:hypothetical protein [Williamsia herbipolensis]
MAAGKAGDSSRGRWLGFAVLSLYPDVVHFDGAVAPLRLRIDSEGDHILVEAARDGLTAVLCPKDEVADVTVSGESDDVFGFLAGQQIGQSQVAVVGDDDARRRLEQLTSHAHTHGIDLAQF